MSEVRSSRRTKHPRPEDVIGLQDIVLEYVLSRRWKDYDQFARTLSLRLLGVHPRTSKEISNLVLSMTHPFFRFNDVSKKQFLMGFPIESLLARVTSPILTREYKRTPRKRLQIGPKIRILILERDNFRCKLCGKTARDTTLEVDHIVPVALGGKNSLDNLQTVCIDCNRGKSDMDLNIPRS